MRSKRESTAPSELCNSTSASASSTVPLVTAPPCQSSHTATSPRPACGATAERREKARGNGDVDAVEIGRQPPIARVARAGIRLRVVGDEGLRRDLDVLRELRRRQPSGLDRQHLVVAAQAAATSWNAHAMLRAASRYSTRLLRTSTSMSGGTCTVGCSPLTAGAPCKR